MLPNEVDTICKQMFWFFSSKSPITSEYGKYDGASTSDTHFTCSAVVPQHQQPPKDAASATAADAASSFAQYAKSYAESWSESPATGTRVDFEKLFNCC